MYDSDICRYLSKTMNERWFGNIFRREELIRSMAVISQDGAAIKPSQEVAERLQEFTYRSRDAGIANAVGIQLGIVYPIVNELEPGEFPLIRRWRAAARSGRLVGAFAVTEPTGGSKGFSLDTKIVKVEDDYRLIGAKSLISLACEADIAIVVADFRGSPAVAVVDMAAPNIYRTPEDLFTLRTCPVGKIDFDGVPLQEHGFVIQGPDATALIRRCVALDRAFIWQLRLGRLRSIIDEIHLLGTRSVKNGKTLGGDGRYINLIGHLLKDWYLLRTSFAAALDEVLVSSGHRFLGPAAIRLHAGEVLLRASSALLKLTGAQGLTMNRAELIYWADAQTDHFGGGVEELLVAELRKTYEQDRKPNASPRRGL